MKIGPTDATLLPCQEDKHAVCFLQLSGFFLENAFVERVRLKGKMGCGAVGLGVIPAFLQTLFCADLRRNHDLTFG